MSSNLESIEAFTDELARIENKTTRSRLYEGELADALDNMMKGIRFNSLDISDGYESDIENDKNLRMRIRNLEIEVQTLNDKFENANQTISTLKEEIAKLSLIKDRLSEPERSIERDSKENVAYLIKAFGINLRESCESDALSTMQGMFSEFSNSKDDSVKLLKSIREGN